jgi:hypothetical protein
MKTLDDRKVYIGGPRTEEGKQRASQNAIKHGCNFTKTNVML